MRFSTNFGLSLAALLFTVILIPGFGWATTGSETQDCPQEPMQKVPIVSGLTYWGSHCALYTTGDIDSFTFKGLLGDTWSMVLGLGANPTTNICLTLYDPNGKLVTSGCTNAFGCGTICSSSVSTTQLLNISGTYTIVATEASNATVTYGLTLERLSPTPPEAIPLVLAKNITGDVSPPTAQDSFTFKGSTSSTYEEVVSLGPNAHNNVCFMVYNPDGTVAANPGCTNAFGCGTICSSTISARVTPATTGTYVVVVNTGGNDGNVPYNLEVSCLVGTCPSQPKVACLLTDKPTYNATSDTLTMKFYIETQVAATWNAWLSSHNNTQQLWSKSELPIKSPTEMIMTKKVSPSDVAGVLSTLTTPTGGITCSSWQTVNTGP